jgi:hypothetical protein
MALSAVIVACETRGSRTLLKIPFMIRWLILNRADEGEPEAFFEGL